MSEWRETPWQELVARLELERAIGMPRWRLERSQPAQQHQQRVADELAARRGAKITRGKK